MKTFLMILALFSGLAGLARAQSPEGYDFRQVRWGFSIDEVKSAEYWQQLLKEDPEAESLLYRIEEEDGQPVEVTYYFRNGRLFSLSFEMVGDYEEEVKAFNRRYQRNKAPLPDDYKEFLGVRQVQAWHNARSQIECRLLENGKIMINFQDLETVLPVIDNTRP